LGLIKAAVNARVFSPGGCFGQLTSIKADSSAFFRDLRVINASCVAEHGDTVYTTVGMDDETIYLFDGPADFEFLLHRHAPRLNNASDYLEYAREALVFSGRLSGAAQIIGGTRATPPNVPRNVQQRLRSLEPRVVISRGGRRSAVFAAYTADRVSLFEVAILHDGRVFADSRVLWAGRAKRSLN
jgi:hypothetical protein